MSAHGDAISAGDDIPQVTDTAPDAHASFHPHPSLINVKQSPRRTKPTVVGVYGIQGCGKTTLLNHLRRELGEQDYLYFDGSDMISSVTPGGLVAFIRMDNKSQYHYRSLAIEKIGQECLDRGKIGLVAGHFSLQASTETGDTRDIHTQSDLDTYTHILYMDISSETVAKFRREDQKRERTDLSVEALKAWQEQEKEALRNLCNARGILFTMIPDSDGVDVLASFLHLVGGLRSSSEQVNERRAIDCLDHIVAPFRQELETVILLDADKTLAPVDAAELFWGQYSGQTGCDSPLKRIFSSPVWKYRYEAFVQASWLYKGIPSDTRSQVCDIVASKITIHPEFQSLFRTASMLKHVRIIVITSGITEVWERVIRNANFSDTVQVIGSTSSPEEMVVTPSIKAAVVTRLQKQYGLLVFAFGDSEVDIPMLEAADHAFVVSGPVKTRSKRMDIVLDGALRRDGLAALQVLLPPESPPRLTADLLPVVAWNEGFVDRLLRGPTIHTSRPTAETNGKDSLPRKTHFTGTTAAKLLMTSMRDAKVAGPALRAAHQRAGWFLATWALSQGIGLETFPIDHVQGQKSEGHRLRGEHKTTIVALMRGGEPMALGVNEVFPSAVFVHAKQPEDVKEKNILGQETILLVDSVVNTGKSVMEFVTYIRQIDKAVRIMIVAGVIQAKFFDSQSELSCIESNTHFVALRVSDNQFKGKGTTDTGHRLYNTTHLD